MHKFNKSHKQRASLVPSRLSIDETNQRGGHTITMHARRPPRTTRGLPFGGPNDLPLQANTLPPFIRGCLVWGVKI
jgi:hypothetical protein